MGKDGYHAVRWLRGRTPEQRGGNVKADDGLTREGPTLAVLMDEYLHDPGSRKVCHSGTRKVYHP